LLNNTTAWRNTGVGHSSMKQNTTGRNNTALGWSSLYANITGHNNTAIGWQALRLNRGGHQNTALGLRAGYSNRTGRSNIFIGGYAGFSETGSNNLYIANNKTTPAIYAKMNSIAANTKLGFGTTSVGSANAIKVWNGASLSKAGVWTNASSRTLKDNIRTLTTDEALDTLTALEPVRYVYKNSPEEEYVGFIAEDVPELVAVNDRKSLAAMDIVAVLTKVAKEQQSELDSLASVVDTLTENQHSQTEQLQKKDSEIAALQQTVEELSAQQHQLMAQLSMLMQKVEPQNLDVSQL